MPFVASVHNAAVDAATALIAYVSLHSADPAGTGANELTGGSPAYARQAVAFGAASASVGSMTGTETFDVAAGSTVAYVGFWSAVTGGTFRGSDQLSATEVYAGQGTYTLSALTVTGSST